MPAPQDRDEALIEEGGTAALLIRNKPRIVDTFQARVRAMLAPDMRLSVPMTIDTLPAFLTSLGVALSPRHARDFASQDSSVALLHGSERAKLSNYSLRQVVREYQVLRQIIAEVLREHGRATVDDWDVMHRSIDEAISEAATAFVQVHQEMRDRFTATLTHDLRGPLAAARYYGELILRLGDDATKRESCARGAVQNIDRIARMISELLDINRVSMGEPMTLRLEAAELGEVVRTAMEDLFVIHSGRLHVVCEREIHGAWSRDYLGRAVHNLIENAVKYGAADTAITVRLLAEHGRAIVSVHNQGDPIAEHERARLFQPYLRAAGAASGDREGWGLGLSFVQTVAEAHGGSVAVESSAKLGTTFTLDFLQDARQR